MEIDAKHKKVAIVNGYISCPECKQDYRIPSDKIASEKKVRCKKCRSIFIVDPNSKTGNIKKNVDTFSIEKNDQVSKKITNSNKSPLKNSDKKVENKQKKTNGLLIFIRDIVIFIFVTNLFDMILDGIGTTPIAMFIGLTLVWSICFAICKVYSKRDKWYKYAFILSAFLAWILPSQYASVSSTKPVIFLSLVVVTFLLLLPAILIGNYASKFIIDKKSLSMFSFNIFKRFDKKIAVGGIVSIAAIFVICTTFIFSFGDMSTEDLVSKTESSVALISHESGVGSGFMVTENILATNFHVIDGVFTKDIDIFFPSDGNESFKAVNVIYFDEERDIALIEIDGYRNPLELESHKDLKHGQDLAIIGSPSVSGQLVLKNSVTRGTLNSESNIDGQNYLQISASINPGNSGGPALNYDGKVVAMITLKATKQEGITFGIPIKNIVAVIENTKSVDQNKREITNSQFLANSLYKRINEFASINHYAMSLYIEGMNLALERRLSANEGLKLVSNKIDDNLSEINDSISPDKIDKYLRIVYQSDSIDDDVKEGLIDLWKCSNEINEYVERPRGNLESYTERWAYLGEKLVDIREILSIKLNIHES